MPLPPNSQGFKSLHIYKKLGSCYNRREMCRAQLLKKWHNPRTQYKPIRIKWVQDGTQVDCDKILILNQQAK